MKYDICMNWPMYQGNTPMKTTPEEKTEGTTLLKSTLDDNFEPPSTTNDPKIQKLSKTDEDKHRAAQAIPVVPQLEIKLEQPHIFTTAVDEVRRSRDNTSPHNLDNYQQHSETDLDPEHTYVNQPYIKPPIQTREAAVTRKKLMKKPTHQKDSKKIEDDEEISHQSRNTDTEKLNDQPNIQIAEKIVQNDEETSAVDVQKINQTIS